MCICLSGRQKHYPRQAGHHRSANMQHCSQRTRTEIQRLFIILLFFFRILLPKSSYMHVIFPFLFFYFSVSEQFYIFLQYWDIFYLCDARRPFTIRTNFSDGLRSEYTRSNRAMIGIREGGRYPIYQKRSMTHH